MPLTRNKENKENKQDRRERAMQETGESIQETL